MTHSSIGIFASAVRGPLAGLALGVTMAVIGLLAGGGPSLSTAMESIRLRPSARVTATLEVDGRVVQTTTGILRASSRR